MADGGRVIAGLAGGTRLERPPAATRPLTDRVKQSLFASLEAAGAFAGGGAFLDLFAGSGAGGIEALSRGAGRAVFVEHDRRACAVIEANLRRTGLAGSVLCIDALRYLAAGAGAGGGPFSAALLDPPYGDAALQAALAALAAPPGGWLAADAIVVAKHFWRDTPPASVGNLHIERTRRYGETALTFLRAEEDR